VQEANLLSPKRRHQNPEWLEQHRPEMAVTSPRRLAMGLKEVGRERAGAPPLKAAPTRLTLPRTLWSWRRRRPRTRPRREASSH
jgi:hypothetical protein